MEAFQCSICHKKFHDSEIFSAELIRAPIQKIIRNENPEWNIESRICASCLDRYRRQLFHDLLEEEMGDLSALDERVIESLSEHQVITENINAAYEEKLSFGQWLSDRIASFGGSWLFLSLFALFLGIWIVFNAFGPKADEFDPYPFILLNLILSCLAAIQAPVIMMSQNRQDARDRIRSEHDYLVNLKAELEIRQLHMKMDQLLKHQWRRLLEIQQLQMDLMNEALKKKK